MARMFRVAAAFIVFASLLSGFSEAFAGKTMIRAAFDVGSGSTKMKVAEVDIEQQKIVRILFPTDDETRARAQIKVTYKEDLQKQAQDKTPVFSEDILKQGRDALTKLQEEARKFGATEFAGVATSAFRTAQNGEEFLRSLHQDLNIAIQIISQEEEAKIGYLSALYHAAPEKTQDVISWDIGAGSMQVTTYHPAVDFSQFLAKDFGAVSFKNTVIEEIKKQDPKKTFSPNPLSKEEVKEARKLAADIVEKMSKDMNPNVNHDLSCTMGHSTRLVGIGGALYQGVKGQFEACYKRPFPKELKLYQLEHILECRAGKTDTELNSKFPETDVTNLIFIIEFMKKFDRHTIEPVPADLTEGLLVYPDYWRR